MSDNDPAGYRGRIVTVRTGTIDLPDGAKMEIDVVEHPGGAAVVALDHHDRVCLLEQHRHVIGRRLCEIPAGRLEPGEDPIFTARRELAEEAGLQAAHWLSLGAIVSSPGVFTEVVHLFLARELTATSAQLEPGEILELKWLPLASAMREALNGTVEDAKTVIALVRAASRLGIAPEA